MVIDTSAVIAILLKEPEHDRFIGSIASDPVRLMSTVNALEAGIVIEARKRDQGGRELDLLLHKAKIDIIPFTHEHSEEARIAWRKYGKGNHIAGLNFCDCCAYALSKVSGEPLLFKGIDFSKTGIAVVAAVTAIPGFQLPVQETYHVQGFFNVPVEFGSHFGNHNTTIEIYVDDAPEPLLGLINRTAQRNGAPRIMGHAGLREYFRSKCKPGDMLDVMIESPQRIRIRRVS